MQNYLATTLPGIGAIAKKQLKQWWDISVKETSQLRTNDILEFEFDGEWQSLLRPSTLEDVFLHLYTLELDGSKDDLLGLRKYCRIMAPQMLHNFHEGQMRSLRVVAMAADHKWRKYRRMDMERTAELGLAENLKTRFKVVAENASAEIWLFQVEHKLLITLRLSDRSLRHREYKVTDYPGSLRPTVANAMVYLSRPQAEDIFLDPMCGAGTIIIERALAGRVAMLHGYDHDRTAVRATLDNLDGKHKPWKVKVAEAQLLPLADAGVDVIVTNPPWNVQMEADAGFYVELYAELGRVLKPGGRFVLLGKEIHLGKQKLAPHGLMVKEIYKNISVLGQTVEIVVGYRVAS